MNINSRTSKINFTGFKSGAIASFTGLRAAPAKVKVNTTGVTECNVVRCGANVWDEQWEQGGYDNDGNKNTITTVMRNKNPIRVKPETTYYFHRTFAAGTLRRVFWDENMNCLYSQSSLSANVSFTTPAGAVYMGFNTDTNYGNTYKNDISINYPATDTDYHAYNGNTYTIPVGQMVTQIDQIIGTNNIFSDSGNVEVYYVTI